MCLFWVADRKRCGSLVESFASLKIDILLMNYYYFYCLAVHTLNGGKFEYAMTQRRTTKTPEVVSSSSHFTGKGKIILKCWAKEID